MRPSLPARLVGLALALVLSACAEPPPPPAPTTVALQIAGEPTMNGGAPAKVKIYYLNSDANFIASDFFALWDNAAATLGQDLVTVDEYLLAPGQSVTDSKTFDAAVPHIGAVVGLRNIDSPGWKANSGLTPRGPNPIALKIAGSGASFGPGSAGGDGALPVDPAAAADAAKAAAEGGVEGAIDVGAGAAKDAASGATDDAASALKSALGG